jgi:hypothetical protein
MEASAQPAPTAPCDCAPSCGSAPGCPNAWGVDGGFLVAADLRDLPVDAAGVRPDTHPLLDGQLDQHLRGAALALADEAEQDVLGADVVVIEHPGLFLSQDHHPSRRSVNLSNVP